jgi:adenosylcobinamide-GDP ribazoletransferase
MWRGMVTAIRTLTLFPVPGREAANMAGALPWFPIVGFMLGVILYGFSILFGYDRAGQWPSGTAVLLVVAGTVFTRGLHLDGLSDWADGFWGGRDRESTLRIMKDPHTGAFGVVAIVSMLLAKYVCFAELIRIGFQPWIVAALVVSRTAQVWMACSLPYARAEGGKAAPFVQGARPWHMAAATVLAALLLAAWSRAGVWLWVLAVGVAWLMMRFMAVWSRARIHGVTGDVLGATSEIIEVSILALGVVCRIGIQSPGVYL